MSKIKNYNLGTLPPVPYGYGSIAYTERNKKNPWLAQYTDEQTKKRKTLGYFSEYMQAYNALIYRKDGKNTKSVTANVISELVRDKLLQLHDEIEVRKRTLEKLEQQETELLKWCVHNNITI